MTDPAALAVLRRIRSGRRQPAGERCEMCGESITDEHSHVVDLGNRALMCTCRPCSLLFDYPDAKLKYKAVPNRYLAVSALPAPVWDDLQIPVDVAFFFVNSELGRVVGVYPEPGRGDRVGAPARRLGRGPGRRARAGDDRPGRGGAARPGAGDPHQLLRGADRRLLRAGRPAAPALARLRRRPGRAPGARRVLRPDRGAVPVTVLSGTDLDVAGDPDRQWSP